MRERDVKEFRTIVASFYRKFGKTFAICGMTFDDVLFSLIEHLYKTNKIDDYLKANFVNKKAIIKYDLIDLFRKELTNNKKLNILYVAKLRDVIESNDVESDIASILDIEAFKRKLNNSDAWLLDQILMGRRIMDISRETKKSFVTMRNRFLRLYQKAKIFFFCSNSVN
jgi:hypothetical protein